MKIEILTTPDCSNCAILEKMLDQMDISYQVIDVTEKPEYLTKYPIFTAPGLVIRKNWSLQEYLSKKSLKKSLKKNNLNLVTLFILYKI